MPTRAFVAIPGPLSAARFVDRPNRFVVRCRLEGGGRLVDAHLPDPGRLRELLAPERRVWLRSAAPTTDRRSGRGRRKTAWTAVMVQAPEGGDLVSMDTTLPNRLVKRALRSGALGEFGGWTMERAEVRIGGSRFDFVLSRADGRRLALEVKSVTLVQRHVGLFPDAITARGARHVRELAALVARGAWDAAVLFVVQRRDVRRVAAARDIDPTFADALASAKHAGVRVLGRRCHVELERVTLGGAVGVG